MHPIDTTAAAAAAVACQRDVPVTTTRHRYVMEYIVVDAVPYLHGVVLTGLDLRPGLACSNTAAIQVHLCITIHTPSHAYAAADVLQDHCHITQGA